jgi:hypothetical protein
MVNEPALAKLAIKRCQSNRNLSQLVLRYEQAWTHTFQITTAILPVDMPTKGPANIDRIESAEAVSGK